MKYILEKDKIKSFFKKRFGVDLTDKITMITSVKDIPRKFIRVIVTGVFNNMLNKFGPMYLIKVKDSEYLTQERNDIYKDYWFVLSDKDADDIFSIGKGSDPLLKELGLDGLGINLGTIIDIYFEEEIDAGSLNEGDIKNFIQKKLGIDLSGRIKIVTNANDVPSEFMNRYLSHPQYNRAMNSHGPFYHIIGNDLNFLVQPRSDENGETWIGRTNDGEPANDSLVLKNLGLNMLGLSLSNIIDLYFNEDESDTISENITESKKFIDIIGDYMSINYPNFTKENVKIVKARKNKPGVFRPEMSINYYNPVNEFLFAKYWHNDVNKDIQLDCDIFNDLEMTFGGHMDKIVDWFNNEFGQDAESVTC